MYARCAVLEFIFMLIIYTELIEHRGIPAKIKTKEHSIVPREGEKKIESQISPTNEPRTIATLSHLSDQLFPISSLVERREKKIILVTKHLSLSLSSS